MSTAVCCLAAAGAGTASAGSAGAGDPYFPQDGDGGYTVSRYDVGVSLDPATPESFAGDTTVFAEAKQDLDRFDLDLEGFTVSSVLVNGSPAKAVARSGAHKLVITPAQTVHKGSPLTVRVRYSGAPTGRSWHRLKGGGVNVTGEPHSATAWFPVNDHPSKKAALHLEATVPSAWSVVGNGLPGPVTSRDGKTTYRWNEDRPIASYATTMAVDKFTVRTSKLGDGTPVIHAYGQNTSILPDSENLVPDILGFLSSKFGPYPFSSAGSIVVAPERSDGSVALETQTRPTYAGAFYDVSAVHELAHQWFGDSVSFSDWRDGCIAECFAQYAGQLWDEHRDGADLDKNYRESVAEHKNDAAFWSVHLYDPGKEHPLDAALYDRGPLMLHALRRTVGDDIFFATLKAWQAKYRYGNASWLDFEKLAAQQSGKDLRGFFQAWAHSSVIPPDPYLHPGPLKA
ncbi:M1 family metallopeptidase [Amycolatopsis panacis]|uniref:M1 family metallopeptidase n=1 Tax=Amycolatopsis panacis TaxID=2340917 RepID=UPI0018F68BFA|nr:M1 family metallopeptidase [Amycolatopsis panacis]